MSASMRRARRASGSRASASSVEAGRVTVLGAFDSAEEMEVEMRRRWDTRKTVEPTPGEVHESQQRAFLRKDGGSRAASYGLRFKRRDPEKLHEELRGLELSELRRRALAFSVATDRLDEAYDADDIETAVIDLVVEAALAQPERKVAHQRHVNAATAAREKNSKGHWDGVEVVRQEAGAPPSAVGAMY